MFQPIGTNATAAPPARFHQITTDGRLLYLCPVELARPGEVDRLLTYFAGFLGSRVAHRIVEVGVDVVLAELVAALRVLIPDLMAATHDQLKATREGLERMGFPREVVSARFVEAMQVFCMPDARGLNVVDLDAARARRAAQQ
jgi:hypothetical protein